MITNIYNSVVHVHLELNVTEKSADVFRNIKVIAVIVNELNYGFF